MRKVSFVSLLAIFVLAVTAPAVAEVQGVYIESRNAEVYASHCFANSEGGLEGDLAVMAWKIEEGSWKNVSLNGLGVVAVVKASNTLGDPFNNPLPAKAALIFDEAATAEQREALEGFVKEMGGELLTNVVRRDARPIELDLNGNLHARRATLKAGELVALTTREIRGTDSLCHLDDLYYEPLVALEHAMPAFAVRNSYHGDGLNVSIDDYNRSSAYLGTFRFAGTSYTD
jgi:hypothetical protein